MFDDRGGALLARQTQSLSALLHAGQSDEALAIAAPEREPLTYGGLRRQLAYVLQSLREIGFCRGDRIALVLPNGPDMAVAFLGVAAAAAAAPLNPGYRAEEFEFYLRDLNARALIVQAGFDSAAIAVARQRGCAIVELTAARPAGAFTLCCNGAAKSVDAIAPLDDEVALLLHTSGTTSRPKLVPLSQSNLCVSAINIRDALALTGSDRCLNVMPLFHIHGLVGALLSSLAAGGSIVCAPGFDAPRFFEWMQERRPTWYTAVPTMHQAILAHVRDKSSARAIIARNRLRLIRSSSAALPASVMAELEAVFQAPVIESYGMTEAAHQMASSPLPPRTRKPRSVGVAAGPRIAIMDSAGAQLAQGETGEVVIRGGNVSAGYENNPEANQASFTDGWFRTGDQGYLDAEGYLFLTGRLKEIINRGGEKISPREIDEALLEHPAIAQAVAFALPHPTLGEDIAAAVVLKEQNSTSPQTIREFLFQHLTDFKVPSQVVIVPSIPKGATGKLQRIGLADKLSEYLRETPTAPGNEIEQAVVDIFAEVLKIENFGVHDNFFALGGDSLRATQVMARVFAVFGVDLPNVAMFRQPTVAELAGELARLIENLDEPSPEILAEIEHLSPIEIERLLADEVGK
ncbi:MAG: AMP-binding protein [Burkholderiales bacterium]|nr:AMP-binding protein [Burkholderiales bacterium]